VLFSEEALSNVHDVSAVQAHHSLGNTHPPSLPEVTVRKSGAWMSAAGSCPLQKKASRKAKPWAARIGDRVSRNPGFD
jgi:hypothetical protein